MSSKVTSSIKEREARHRRQALAEEARVIALLPKPKAAPKKKPKPEPVVEVVPEVVPEAEESTEEPEEA